MNITKTEYIIFFEEQTYKLVHFFEEDDLIDHREEVITTGSGKELVSFCVSKGITPEENELKAKLWSKHYPALAVAHKEDAMAKWLEECRLNSVTDDAILQGKCIHAEVSGDIITIKKKDGDLWDKGREPIYCHQEVVPGSYYCKSCLEEWF